MKIVLTILKNSVILITAIRSCTFLSRKSAILCEMELSGMKKFIACIVALMVCASMVLPAYAAPTFTPSVTNKPSPDIVPVIDPDGNPALAEIVRGDEVVGYVYEDCLIVTSVADALTSKYIPAAARDLLLSVYEKLSNGQMKLPYDKFKAGLKADKMVIRDLFDVSFLCAGTPVDHPAMLEPDGVVLRLTFDLGVGKNDKVYTMTYKDGDWNTIVSTVNNGDGTVTCTFEHLCPVAFSVDTSEAGTDTPPSETGDPDGENLIMWIVIATVSLVAVVALVVVYRTKLSKKS